MAVEEGSGSPRILCHSRSLRGHLALTPMHPIAKHKPAPAAGCNERAQPWCISVRGGAAVALGGSQQPGDDPVRELHGPFLVSTEQVTHVLGQCQSNVRAELDIVPVRQTLDRKVSTGQRLGRTLKTDFGSGIRRFESCRPSQPGQPPGGSPSVGHAGEITPATCRRSGAIRRRTGAQRVAGEAHQEQRRRGDHDRRSGRRVPDDGSAEPAEH